MRMMQQTRMRMMQQTRMRMMQQTRMRMMQQRLALTTLRTWFDADLPRGYRVPLNGVFLVLFFLPCAALALFVALITPPESLLVAGKASPPSAFADTYVSLCANVLTFCHSCPTYASRIGVRANASTCAPVHLCPRALRGLCTYIDRQVVSVI
jgi:hypothetical protein